ncbi:MAG: tetratricopeptide repeat protein [Acidobacteriota bacterium]|nr:tetratricopeptide repeat protein [Acidobacteriota bacterium]
MREKLPLVPMKTIQIAILLCAMAILVSGCKDNSPAPLAEGEEPPPGAAIHYALAKFDRGEYENAIPLFEKAMTELDTHPPENADAERIVQLKAEVNNYIGVSYSRLDKKGEAIEYLLKANAYYDPLTSGKHKHVAAIIQYSLGSAYLGVEDNEKAREWFAKSIERAESMGDKKKILGSAHTRIAQTYYKLGQIEDAIQHGEKGRELCREKKSPKLLCEALTLLETAYGETNNETKRAEVEEERKKRCS